MTGRRVGKGALLRAVPTALATLSAYSLLRWARFALPTLRTPTASYSGLMLADFISGHHFSISAFW